MQVELIEVSKTQTMLVVSEKAAKVISNVQAALNKTPTGVCFVRINNYTNKQGAVTNYLINIGIKNENQKAKDLKTLQTLDMVKAKEKFGFKSALVDLVAAQTELINSMIKPSESRSLGQINAYTKINDGLKVHNETGLLYIYGYTVKKEVIVKGEYKTVNSSAKTIAKQEISKILRTGKFSNFCLEIGNELKVNKDTIEL